MIENMFLKNTINRSPQRGRYPRWTKEEEQVIETEYKKGTSYSKIGIMLGKAKDTVQKKAIRMGFSERTPQWTLREVEQLQVLYKTGLDLSKIAETLCRSIPSVAMKCSNLGLSERLTYWTEKDIEILKSEYVKRTSSRKIASMLNKDIFSIRTKANELKITHPRLYEVNHNYFEIINSQKKAYWLGWLITDGYIRSDSRRIVLKLAAKDIDVLEDLKHDLQADYPINYERPRKTIYKGIRVNGTGAYYLAMTSEKMKNDLAKYGVIPNKTYICKFPHNLKEEYYPGFVAGAISGDGSISIYKKKNALAGNIVGTKELIESMKKILVTNTRYNNAKKILKRTDSKNLYSLCFSTGQVILLYWWFKENGISLMPRKNKIIEDYITAYPEKCNIMRAG